MSSKLALGCLYARRDQFNWWCRLNPSGWKPPQVQVRQLRVSCSFQADQFLSKGLGSTNRMERCFNEPLACPEFLMLIIVNTVLLPHIVEIYCNDLRWGSTQARFLWELKKCVFRLLLRALTLRQSTVFMLTFPKVCRSVKCVHYLIVHFEYVFAPDLLQKAAYYVSWLLSANQFRQL